MNISNTTTQIKVYPLVSMPNPAVGMSLIIEHKQTKTVVSATVAPTYSNSSATFALPSLSAINSIAAQGDELLVRVIYNNALYFEAMAYWITGTVSPNKIWKSFTTLSGNSNDWKTLP